jgi:hypothetical protein
VRAEGVPLKFVKRVLTGSRAIRCLAPGIAAVGAYLDHAVSGRRAALAVGIAAVTAGSRSFAAIGHANIAAANRRHAGDPQRTLKLLQTA